MRSETGSPGHTPLPSSPGGTGAASAATGAHSAFGSATPAMPPVLQHGPDDNVGSPESEVIPARHGHANSSVTVVAAPGHDNFNPVHGGDRSPGHTPLPFPLAGTMLQSGSGRRSSAHASSSVAQVTVRTPTGKTDDFNPLHAGNDSPGHTPHAGSPTRQAQPTDLQQHGSTGSTVLHDASVSRRSSGSQRVSVKTAPGHDDFQPMRNPAEPESSPGATPMYAYVMAAAAATGGADSMQEFTQGCVRDVRPTVLVVVLGGLAAVA